MQNEGRKLRGMPPAIRSAGAGRISSITDRQGFTLIEVLIAITVFSIGILAVALMQSHSTSTNARAMAITHATTLAAEKVEELQGLDYTNADLNPTTPSTPHTPASNPPGYVLKWEVTDNTPITGVKQIVVTVQNTFVPPTTTKLTTYKVKTY